MATDLELAQAEARQYLEAFPHSNILIRATRLAERLSSEAQEAHRLATLETQHIAAANTEMQRALAALQEKYAADATALEASHNTALEKAHNDLSALLVAIEEGKTHAIQEHEEMMQQLDAEIAPLVAQRSELQSEIAAAKLTIAGLIERLSNV